MTACLLCLTNEPLKFPTDDGGMIERVNYVEFPNKFIDEDNDMVGDYIYDDEDNTKIIGQYHAKDVNFLKSFDNDKVKNCFFHYLLKHNQKLIRNEFPDEVKKSTQKNVEEGDSERLNFKSKFFEIFEFTGNPNDIVFKKYIAYKVLKRDDKPEDNLIKSIKDLYDEDIIDVLGGKNKIYIKDKKSKKNEYDLSQCKMMRIEYGDVLKGCFFGIREITVDEEC